MKDNKNMPVPLELKIGFGKPFIPDDIGKVGMLFGAVPFNKKSKFASIKPFSRVAVIEYKLDGFYYKLYFRRGKWKVGKNDHPMYCVSGLLR